MTNINLLLPLMAGIDIPIPELQITVRQPRIKDIAYMGEQSFLQTIQYLCIDKKDVIQDKAVISSISNFQIFMKVISDSSKRMELTTLLLILLPDYQVNIMPHRGLLLMQEGVEEVKVIDDHNFDIFQAVMRQVLCFSYFKNGDSPELNPQGELARKIAEKMMKNRQKIAELKAKESQHTSIFTRYLSILTIGARMRLEDCINLTLFQLFDLIERYTSYVEWDIDVRSRLAGAKSDKEIGTWMKDLHL